MDYWHPQTESGTVSEDHLNVNTFTQNNSSANPIQRFSEEDEVLNNLPIMPDNSEAAASAGVSGQDYPGMIVFYCRNQTTLTKSHAC